MSSIDEVAEQIKAIRADAVYMLLHPGWEREARANRWHFAKRWAAHLEVVIVSPDLPWAGRVTKPEARIQNCRILKVASNQGPQWQPTAKVQIGQILDDLAISGHSRPILWLYNANFAEAFTTLPAAARVHHITENYFDYPAMSPAYLDRVRTVTHVANLNIAVSEGCAAPLRASADRERLIVVTNGCDFAEYSSRSEADGAVKSLRQRFTRIAVFGGNINDRLDFDLIERAAHQCPSTLLLFAGPVGSHSKVKSRFAALLKRPNVKSLGVVDPDRLPAIYRAADFGFIPYKLDRLLVENGFPLKALEMAAAGLPVVSTYMRPLEALSPPLTVARNKEDFLAAFAKAQSNAAIDDALRTLAAANDYNSKFAAIVSRLAALTARSNSDHGVASYDASSPECFRKALHNYRRSWRGRANGLYYRLLLMMQRLVSAMPWSIIQLLRKIKWTLRGEQRK